MPTVMRIGGLRVLVYPNDHRPAHVHVIGDGHEAVFLLGGSDGAVDVRVNYGFPARELVRICGMLLEHRGELIEAWESIHGR